MKDPQLIIDMFTSNEEEYAEGEIVWKVRVINLSDNVFERRWVCKRDVNDGNPVREEIEDDFFINRQEYKHTGTVRELNEAAMKRNQLL